MKEPKKIRTEFPETLEAARELARAHGYPVVVQASFVNGGWSVLVHTEENLAIFFEEAQKASPIGEASLTWTKMSAFF